MNYAIFSLSYLSGEVYWTSNICFCKCVSLNICFCKCELNCMLCLEECDTTERICDKVSIIFSVIETFPV